MRVNLGALKKEFIPQSVASSAQISERLFSPKMMFDQSSKAESGSWLLASNSNEIALGEHDSLLPD
jgi:hypothetical protein